MSKLVVLEENSANLESLCSLIDPFQAVLDGFLVYFVLQYTSKCPFCRHFLELVDFIPMDPVSALVIVSRWYRNGLRDESRDSWLCRVGETLIHGPIHGEQSFSSLNDKFFDGALVVSNHLMQIFSKDVVR